MTERMKLIVDVGSGALGHANDVPVATLNLSSHHPSAHGLIRLHLDIEDNVVVEATPEIGYMHRGAEKLLESRDYRQGLALANRHDWLGAFCGELGYAIAVEAMLGLDVPERAQWLRTLVAELTRIISHLHFLDHFPVEAVSDSLDVHEQAQTEAVSVHGVSHREQAQHYLEVLTGGRVHPMYAQIGGLREDAPEGWLDDMARFVNTMREQDDHIAPYLTCEPLTHTLRAMGVLNRELVTTHGGSGPVARAAGIDIDLRRDQPYAAYGDLRETIRVIGYEESDVLARLMVIREQIPVSLDLIDSCIERLRALDGPINVALPKTLRAPEGLHYGWTETPLGIGGYLVASHGERTPWRVKLRTPSLAHVALLGPALIGYPTQAIAPIVSSLFLVTGDMDR